MPGVFLIDQAWALWETLARAPISFTAGVSVVVSPDSAVCPPGWVGIVALGDGVMATAPNAPLAALVRQVLNRLPVTAATDPERLRTELAVVESLGPATLSYVDPSSFQPHPAVRDIDKASPAATEVESLLRAAGIADTEESGMAEITSPAFVVREDRRVVAAAGYQLWPRNVAHLCVLVAPEARNRSLAQQVASMATSHALRDGRLPQWRARPAASRAVSRALGFRELGSQVSLRIQYETRKS